MNGVKRLICGCCSMRQSAPSPADPPGARGAVRSANEERHGKQPETGFPQIGPRRRARRRERRADEARASAEPLGPPSPFAPDCGAGHGARTRQVALQGAQIDAARRLLQSQFRAIFRRFERKPGSAVWSDEKFGFALEPLHRGFIFTTPMQLNIVENGQAQQLIYDRADYDFGKLQPPADLPDLGFSGVRVLKAAAGQGWQDLAIFQGATFFRSLARGQTLRRQRARPVDPHRRRAGRGISRCSARCGSKSRAPPRTR